MTFETFLFCLFNILYTVTSFRPFFLSTNGHLQQRRNRILSNTKEVARSSSTLLLATLYDRCDVAIVGGGFGGLYTALALDRMAKEAQQRMLLLSGQRRIPSLDIVLIDPSDQFVFLPLLYDLTMGTASTREVCPTYQDLLEGTNIRHVKASLKGFSSSTTTNNKEEEKEEESGSISSLSSSLSDKPCSTFQLSPCDPNSSDDILFLSFDKAAVLSVGATPQSILQTVPGATNYTQPFYTQQDAMDTRDLLFQLEQKVRRNHKPKVAVVGGGYGGVELAACLARRLPDAHISLLTRGPPMKGTRAESLVDQALSKLNVTIELVSVDKIEPIEPNESDGARIPSGRKYKGLVRIHRSDLMGNPVDTTSSNDEQWDAVFWTAGSTVADPVPHGLTELSMTTSGRLAVDDTLQCSWNTTQLSLSSAPMVLSTLPPIFALGDCAEIIPTPRPNVPKTAQAAIQQADVVAQNVLTTILDSTGAVVVGKKMKKSSFHFQDLGTVLNLGGPNGAVVGPHDTDSLLGPILIPLLDTARVGLSAADNVVAQILNAPTTDPTSKQIVERLGLSLGGYGLGVVDDDDSTSNKGTLSGTLSGITRRAIYSLRMPTNKQRAYASVSSFVSSVSALAKEASDEYQRVVVKARENIEETTK
ncbi:NADH dehydrogenase, FAD-containing subunit [Nitzschia inconspicua]|uniref:NADH dehydrogenase, FAD-containing subunit n=1 Tax=Nitzschia inconspicua TaxID=303405 RepID=A0A9K3KLY5_9STRA|nr:NADH dehydrogenase, FAD-containing subunit [Nitzschia inconspicua]